MDYKETVNNVMALLKEKGVCTSSQKSHETCYKSLGDFMAERKETYSPELRSSWLESLQPMHTRQRCAVWEQYALQLEEMASTGTVTDRKLYLNVSCYEKLPDSWKSVLDTFLDSCRDMYKERTLELSRIYCSRALLFLADSGITQIEELSFDAIFKLIEMEISCNEKTKRTILNNTARMMRYWAANGWCSAYCSMLLDSRIYPDV